MKIDFYNKTTDDFKTVYADYNEIGEIMYNHEKQLWELDNDMSLSDRMTCLALLSNYKIDKIQETINQLINK